MAVYLVNHPDGADEFLTCNWNLNSIAQSATGYDQGGGSISFSGGADASQYQAVVQTLRYQNNKPNPTSGSRTINVVVSDGTNSVSASTTVSVSGTGNSVSPNGQKNSQPSGTSGSTSTASSGTATSVSSNGQKTVRSLGVSTTNSDGSTVTALVSGTGTTKSLTPLGISATGQLILQKTGTGGPALVSGTGSLLSVNGQKTLQSFGPTLSGPTILTTQPTQIYLGNPSGTATGNGNTVLVAPNASISGGTVWSMAVYLVNRPDGANEFLSCNWNLNSVAMSASGYDAASGSLSFTGGASASAYQAVLRSITYQDNRLNPTAGSRPISVVVSDGTKSISAITTVSVSGMRAFVSGNGKKTLQTLGVTPTNTIIETSRPLSSTARVAKTPFPLGIFSDFGDNNAPPADLQPFFYF